MCCSQEQEHDAEIAKLETSIKGLWDYVVKYPQRVNSGLQLGALAEWEMELTGGESRTNALRELVAGMPVPAGVAESGAGDACRVMRGGTACAAPNWMPNARRLRT